MLSSYFSSNRDLNRDKIFDGSNHLGTSGAYYPREDDGFEVSIVSIPFRVGLKMQSLENEVVNQVPEFKDNGRKSHHSTVVQVFVVCAN